MRFAALVMLAACTGGEVRTNLPGDSGAPGDSSEPQDSPPGDSDPGDSQPPDTDPPDTDPPDTGEPPASGFAVLSLNLHCLKTEGTGFKGNKERFAAVALAAAAEDVALIALQEVCWNETEDAGALLEEALEQATGVSWGMQTLFAHTGWEGTEDEASEGVAVALRGEEGEELVEVEYHVQSSLRRVALGARYPMAEGWLDLLTVHLDNADEPARIAQARQTAVEALTALPDAPNLLVVGDFNDLPGSETIAAMEQMGFVDLGTSLDEDRIDFVFAHRGASLQGDGVRRIFTGEKYPVVSDHPGMLVRITAGEGDDVTLTTLRTEYDAGTGHYLALRGDGAPLDWDSGWPAHQDGSSWSAVFSELEGSFSYKWLLDDATWQQGDNLQGQAGQENEGEVSF